MEEIGDMIQEEYLTNLSDKLHANELWIKI